MNCNIAITTDIWTSLSNDPYIAITAHFFRNENLCHVLLDFDLIPHPHYGEQIKYTVQCVLENFGIINNIISLTTDNATNNVLGISLFKDYLKQELFIEREVFHLSCFGHVLNISVQEGIKTIGSALKNSRSLCSAMKTSSKQKQLLEETSIALKQKYYKLKRDANVRWNSIYVMVESALKLKRVLKSLSCEEKSVFTQNKISDTEWDDLNSILELLKPFYEATFMVSPQSYPSLCVVVPLFDNLLQHLQKQRDNNNLIIKNTAKSMENKLKSYETKLKNDLSYFAVILDPRLNINYFKESQKPEEFAKLKEKFLQFYKINYCNQSFSTSEDTNIKDKTTLMHSIYKKRKISDDEEVERYFEFALEDSNIDLIYWWASHKPSFPHLFRMAFDILNIPATSVPSEQIFSKAGDVITKKRNRLSKDSIQAIMCANSMSKFFKSE
jgi:hypothetical protein